jgi:predicted Zn-dependent protease
MIDTALKAVKDLEKKGCSEAESFIQNSTERIISIRGDTWSRRKKKDISIGLRTIINNKKGFAAGTIPLCSLEEIENASLTLCRNAFPDPVWKHLPYKKVLTTPVGIYDENLVEMSDTDLLDAVNDLVLAGDTLKCSPECTIITRVEETAIANSHGVEGFSKSTKVDINFSCTYRENDIVIDYHSRNFPSCLGTLVDDIAGKALKQEKFSKIQKSFTGDALFLPEALEYSVIACIKWAVNGENFNSGRSQFTRMQDAIASHQLTITDNGLLPHGIRSQPFDGEGNPMQKTFLIEKGVLMNVLHTEYTGNKYGVTSTGNALRSATREPSLDSTNIIVEPGTHSVDALIEHVDKGVLLKDFTGEVDSSSGYFNGRGEGAYIRKGEIQYSCKNLQVQGNAFDVIKNIILLGKDEKCSSDGVYAVPLLTSGVTIIA